MTAVGLLTARRLRHLVGPSTRRNRFAVGPQTIAHPVNRFAQKGGLFSFTPGFSRVIGNGQENRKPFKRFPVLALVQFTWLKPGVNEIEGPKEFRSLAGCG